MDGRVSWIRRVRDHWAVLVAALFYGPMLQAMLVVAFGERWSWLLCAVMSATFTVMTPLMVLFGAWLSPRVRMQLDVRRSIAVGRPPRGLPRVEARAVLERELKQLRRDRWYVPALLLGIAVLVAVAATRTENLAWTLWLYAAVVAGSAPFSRPLISKRLRAATALSDQLDEATSPVG